MASFETDAVVEPLAVLRHESLIDSLVDLTVKRSGRRLRGTTRIKGTMGRNTEKRKKKRGQSYVVENQHTLVTSSAVLAPEIVNASGMEGPYGACVAHEWAGILL
jgi:hypothetical protein